MAIDATVAGADANSYLTVADADALAADDYGPEREWWLDRGLEEKEQALKRATAELDMWLGASWTTYSAEQALLFPRLRDTDGTTPYIPGGVQRATYYQAAFLTRNATVLAAADIRRARGAQSVSEPNMSYTQPTGDESSPLSSRARGAMGVYFVGGSRTVHSVRVAT